MMGLRASRYPVRHSQNRKPYLVGLLYQFVSEAGHPYQGARTQQTSPGGGGASGPIIARCESNATHLVGQPSLDQAC